MRSKVIWLVIFIALNMHAAAQFDFLGQKRLYKSDINDMAISADGKYLVATANQSDVRIFNAGNLTLFTSLHGHNDEVYAATFSPDGKYLATSGLDHQIIIWNTNDWTLQKRITSGQEYITALAFNHDGTLLASASNSSLKIFDAANQWQSITDLIVSDYSWSVAFSRDGKYLAAGIGNAVKLWKTENWKKSDILYGHSKPVYSLGFSPNGKYLATGGADSTICVWTLFPEPDFVRFKAHEERIQKLTFDTKNKYLISGGSDSQVKIWTVGSWQLKETLSTELPVSDIQTFPVGGNFAVATNDGWIKGFGSKQVVSEAPKPKKKVVPVLQETPTTNRKEKRIALLIGNTSYAGDSRLENPKHDVDSLSAALSGLGFEVLKHHDLNLANMNRALNDFGNKLKEAKRKGQFVVSMFYYSGHGVQVNNDSYLIPLNDNIAGEEDIEYEGFNLNRLYSKIENAQAQVNVVVVDACRNNPFEQRFTVGQRLLFPNLRNGMGQPSAQPHNMLLAYSTSPSEVAMDGKKGGNSPYIKVLLKNISKSVSIEGLFKEVRRGVNFYSKGEQIPWTASTLLYDFSFSK